MITLARDGMRTDLERIWRACFGDSPEYVNYFFDNRYNPNACLVYVDETVGRPVAMLHMLECSVTEDSEIVPAQYIYAAATRPDHQGRGIMSQLMEYARRYAAARGQKYMILVPGSRELFRFYEKRGFYRCYKHRSVFMTRRDLVTLSGYGKTVQPHQRHKLPALMLTDVHAVRRDMLIDREGFVTWDYKALKYAAGIHERSGGFITTCADGSDAGYAFCFPEGSTLKVNEFISSSGFDVPLLHSILNASNAEQFELRVPAYNEMFANFGEITDFGMICAVSGRKPISLLTLTGTHIPYLGLALD